MCFYVDSKYPDKKTAKRDIVCYKILDDDFRSLHFGKQYLINHLYLEFNTLIIHYKKCLSKQLSVILEGFHSYSNKKEMKSQGLFLPNGDTSLNLIQVKCIIPKGAEYYYNHNSHEYVSNQIIIKEMIK